MSNLSDFGERKFIDYALRNQSAPASTFYLGVSTSAFAEGDSASQAAAKEPTDTAYQRQAISFGDASSRTISNSSDIEFPEATASQGSIGYWAIFDGSGSTANTVAQGSFTTAKTVATGDVLRVATGDLDISVSSIWGLHWGNALLNGFFDNNQLASTTEGAFNSTSSSNFIWNGNSNSTVYRRYSNYYLAVASTAFDMTTTNNDYWGGVNTTNFSTATTLSSDEKANLDKEPWAISSSSKTFSNVASIYNGKGYARTAISFSAASTTTGTTTMVNSSAVSFPEATASWGSIGYWAIFAHKTPFSQTTTTFTREQREDMFNLFYPIIGGSFTTAKSILSGDVLRINAGDFVLTPQ